MQPRIYTYRITFEEIPHWYWGVHKEKKFGESYLGSPVTHKWVWEFYTPQIQILELFEYSEEGWLEACSVEKRLILPDLKDSLCLNEHCGGQMSSEARAKGGKKNGKIAAALWHAEKDDLGRSIHGVEAARHLHEKKDEKGRSLHGLRAAERLHKDKDENGMSTAVKKLHALRNEEGKSVNSIKGAQRVHSEKDEFGRSVHAMKVHRKKDERGKSEHAVRVGRKPHEMKDEDGKSLFAKKLGRITCSQKWEDPDHPELGRRSAPTLALMQKRRGYPSGPENRRRVEG